MSRRYPKINICDATLGKVNARRLEKKLQPHRYRQNEFQFGDMAFYRHGDHPDLILSISLIGGGRRNEALGASVGVGLTNYLYTSAALHRRARIPELDRRFRWGWDFVHTDEDAMEFESILVEYAPQAVAELAATEADRLLEEHEALLRDTWKYFDRLRDFATASSSYESYFPTEIRGLAERCSRRGGACHVLDLRRLTAIVIGVMLQVSEEVEGSQILEKIMPTSDPEFKTRMSVVMSKLLFCEDQWCVELVNRYYDSNPET
jgi:hypothetical protein